MKARIWALLIITLVIGVTLIAYAVTTIIWPMISPLPADSPATNIASVNAQYLPFTPSWLTREENLSRVFLLSAEPRYGVYKNWNNAAGGLHRGDPCLILNLTLRNDYNAEKQPPPLGSYDFSKGYSVFLKILLFSKNEIVATGPWTVIDSEGKPTMIDSQTNFRYDQTATFDVYTPTDRQDVDHIELYVLEIGPPPVPA